jgi:pentatricopeptide repeat protein
MDRDAISSVLRRKELALPEGMGLHSCAVSSGLDADAFVANLLISMYARCGKFEEAQHVFDRMPIRTMV